VHKEFHFDHRRLFSVQGAVDEWLARALTPTTTRSR
jgi:hypothetical protein